MSEGTDRPTGERRRRREAERAAARAAEQAGATRPLTRRELRWQQAEEAARLEAIATGELPLGQHHERPVPPPMTTPGSAPSAPSAPSTSAAPTPERGSAPSAPSAPASAPTPASAPASAPTPASAPPSEAPSAPPRIPSRRSLRERDPGPASAEQPQERTATGRRPVVRTPSTARGVRALDSTGQLTGIQPVVRPDAPDAPEAQPTAAPVEPEASPGPAVWSERATFSLDLDGPARAARAALPEPATGQSAEEPEDDDLPLRPRWVAIDAVSGASPDAAPSRRSLRAEDPAPEPEPEADVAPAPAPQTAEEPNPAVAAVKIAVLVLVAAILGALIWLLATGAFAGSPTALPTTTITTTHPEETSAS
ncbi:Meckel syndrome type 1 protein [Georgenia satyanarayanai]|uniref:Meckel syndrome type 1 protein n=1 Tax=Georgenia satyanarayanai TaxID=860221 RepID=A0A2Y9AG23_9MICO|nr:hypothetical protein [Georgenia satyanarayanai]PYF99142.1 Meckel syndrome type 1 protein [Georgenia satyanarayanai]SSA43260.1 Meckel syndrome type 1 protein [Georgenia satyanarayanai]